MRSPRFPRRFTLPWRGAKEIRDEVDEELAFHLDMRTDALVREGMERDAAHTLARREFGDLEEARRSMREADAHTESRRRRAHKVRRKQGANPTLYVRTLSNGGPPPVGMLRLCL